jgi:streptogramin lyase
MNSNQKLRFAWALVLALVMSGAAPAAQLGNLLSTTFQRGDVIVSLEPGPVMWFAPDGTFKRLILGTEVGTGEGMAFDAAGNLYVTRWCTDSACSTGNTVEKYSSMGLPAGRFGAGYDCNPHAILFDPLGAAYVGLAGCSGAIVKVAPGGTQTSFPVAPDNQGAFWIDLAPDGCTMFYTSWGPNVKRYDVCANAQLANFNRAPVPGGTAHDLRVLPDGGVLVASGQVITRLDASGAQVQTYGLPEPSLWAGLDLVGDGTFWAGNYQSSNVVRFDLASGAVRASFNTNTPTSTVVGIRVKK